MINDRLKSCIREGGAVVGSIRRYDNVIFNRNSEFEENRNARLLWKYRRIFNLQYNKDAVKEKEKYHYMKKIQILNILEQ